MSQSRHSSLSLRTQLNGLTSELNRCDPTDAFAAGRIAQQLGSVRNQLEKENLNELVPICSLAVRLADVLNRDGEITPVEARNILEETIKEICGALGFEPEEVASIATAATTPTPKAAFPQPAAALGETAQRASLKLVSNRKLGELMVQMSMLTPAQIEQALSHQRMTGCRFGEALVQMRLMPKEAVESALRVQGARKPQKDDWGGGR